MPPNDPEEHQWPRDVRCLYGTVVLDERRERATVTVEIFTHPVQPFDLRRSNQPLRRKRSFTRAIAHQPLERIIALTRCGEFKRRVRAHRFQHVVQRAGRHDRGLRSQEKALLDQAGRRAERSVDGGCRSITTGKNRGRRVDRKQAIRSTLPDSRLTAAVRGAAARLTPAMKVTGVTRQSTLVTNTMLRERLLALLSGFFALVSLALAAVGLYGVLSYTVVQQTREIGIRMALGAARRTVVREVVGGVAAYVALGMAAGVAGGIWLSRLVATLLYEVRPNDLATIAWPVLTLLVVATVAAVLPARRAAGIDPAVTLRDE